MRQFTVPSDEQVANYIIDNSLYDQAVNFCSNKLGSFVLIDGLCLVQQGGKVHVPGIRPDKYDSQITVKEPVHSVDLVCQGYQGFNFDELVKQFGEFKFSGKQAIVSTQYISSLFDEAIRHGFITLKSIYNVDFV